MTDQPKNKGGRPKSTQPPYSPRAVYATPEDFALIDKARGNQPFSEFVRLAALEKAARS